MRKKIIYALVFAMGVSIFGSATKVFATEERVFEILEKSKNPEGYYAETIKLVKTSDGGFLHLIQPSNTSTYTKETVIIKYKNDKTIEWSKSFRGSASNNPMSVTQLNDGSYILVGFTMAKDGDFERESNTPIGDWDGFIFKLDKDGNAINKKYLTGSNYEHIDNVIPTEDGGFLIAGVTYSKDLPEVVNETNGAKSFVIKYDKDFNQLWKIDNHVNYDVNTLAKDINGDIILTESTFSQESLRVYRLNKDGEEKWSAPVDIEIEGEIKVKDTLILPNGDTILIGNETESKSGLYLSTFLFVLDKDGNIINRKTYNTTYNKNEDISSIIETERGYTLVGESNSTNGNYDNKGDYDGFIIEIDKNYNLLNTYGWGESGYDTLTNAINFNGELIFGAISDSTEMKDYGSLILRSFMREVQKLETSEDVMVYFTKADTLRVDISTDTIDFGKVNGLMDEELDEELVVSVSSSANWDMTIKALDDFKGMKDPNNVLPSETLEITLGEPFVPMSLGREEVKANLAIGEYVPLTKEEILLLEDEPNGTEIINVIKFKLKAIPGERADKYMLPIRLTVSQK